MRTKLSIILKKPAVGTSSGVSDVNKKNCDISLSQDKSNVSLQIACAVAYSPVKTCYFYFSYNALW